MLLCTRSSCLCSFFRGFGFASIYWEEWEYPLINLPWNYALVAEAGGLVVATLGTMQNYGSFFIKSGWRRIRESVMKANFQTSLIAFFVFAALLCDQGQGDKSTVFGFYLSTCWPLLVSSNFALPGLFKRLIGIQSTN